MLVKNIPIQLITNPDHRQREVISCLSSPAACWPQDASDRSRTSNSTHRIVSLWYSQSFEQSSLGSWHTSQATPTYLRDVIAVFENCQGSLNVQGKSNKVSLPVRLCRVAFRSVHSGGRLLNNVQLQRHNAGPVTPPPKGFILPSATVVTSVCVCVCVCVRNNNWLPYILAIQKREAT